MFLFLMVATFLLIDILMNSESLMIKTFFNKRNSLNVMNIKHAE